MNNKRTKSLEEVNHRNADSALGNGQGGDTHLQFYEE